MRVRGWGIFLKLLLAKQTTNNQISQLHVSYGFITIVQYHKINPFTSIVRPRHELKLNRRLLKKRKQSTDSEEESDNDAAAS